MLPESHPSINFSRKQQHRSKARAVWSPLVQVSVGPHTLGIGGVIVDPAGSTRHVLLLERVGESVGLGAGFDDVGAEGEPVDDGGAEAGVGEGLGPA